MGRPKASEARDTRQVILDAALELFADAGFHGTGMRDIARAVGIRESALYHHFPNKDALLEALLDEMHTSVVGPHGPGGVPPLPAAQVGPMLEKCALIAVESFGTLRERKRFRVLVSEGPRLAVQGRLDVLGRLGLGGTVLSALMQAGIATGALRKADPDMLVVEFMAPLITWRLFQAVDPQHRFVGDWRSFAKEHVAHFLRAAGAEPKVNVRSTRRSSAGRE